MWSACRLDVQTPFETGFSSFGYDPSELATLTKLYLFSLRYDCFCVTTDNSIKTLMIFILVNIFAVFRAKITAKGLCVPHDRQPSVMCARNSE